MKKSRNAAAPADEQLLEQIVAVDEGWGDMVDEAAVHAGAPFRPPRRACRPCTAICSLPKNSHFRKNEQVSRISLYEQCTAPLAIAM